MGSIPWKKLLEANLFIYEFDRAVEWNNSAAEEEAFRKAKLRYWSEMNGEPCEIPLPYPDMCIDKIDWCTEMAFMRKDQASGGEN